MKKLSHHFNRFSIYYILFLLTLISAIAFFYFSQDGQNLLYADAISRLNIARKVVDNITPGAAQLGNVWLPLPQILMLPLIWHTFLWHSGIAGAVMSMAAFIIGGLYVYKSARLLTNSIVGSTLALSIYALNINLIYLQTTAMSEALFLCTLAGTIYYFLMFFKTNSKYQLIPAALFVSAMTLTRYEGLALLFASIPLVFAYSWFQTKKFRKAESNTLLYGVLACLGFGLWTLYLTAIFGDPLYWKNYYATPQATGQGAAAVYSQAKPFMAAVWQYFTSTVWMDGIVPVGLAFLGILIMVGRDIKNRTFYSLPLLMPLSIFLFMVLTLQRNTPIVQPALTMANIFSSETSYQTGFNIRYGILLLPWVAIMTAFLFSMKNIFIKSLVVIVFMGVFGIQIYSYFYPRFSIIYQIPARIYGKPYASLVNWMKEHYDGGKILISASSHEDQMFEMGFDYKTYIHEGTNKYWKESLDDPPRYATWVVIDKGHKEDKVAKKYKIETVLDRDYYLLYNKEQVKIYRIKNKPYFQIE